MAKLLCLFLEAFNPRGPGLQLEMVSIGERFGKIFLMRYQKDTAHLTAKILQFLNHNLSALTIKTSEAFVDDNRFDGPMLPAGVLANAQSETDGDAEFLAAAEESDVDRPVSRNAIVRFQLERLAGVALALRFATQLQIELAAGQTIQHGVGVLDHLFFRLPH